MKHSPNNSGQAQPEVRRVDAPASAARVDVRALTGLRLVAAMWVVLYHLQTGLEGAFGQYVEPFLPVLRAGWLGVDLFFLLSGFVLTLSYLETMGPRLSPRAVGVFLWARLSRVWPLWAFLTVVFAGFLVLSHYADPGGPSGTPRVVNGGHLVEQLLMVQMWHRSTLVASSFIQPGWSLSVEFLAYVAFPVVVLLLWRARRLPVGLLAAAAVAVMVPMAYLSFSRGVHDIGMPWLLRIAGAFLSGGLVYLVFRQVHHSTAVQRACSWVAPLCVLQVVMVCYWGATRPGGAGGEFSGVAVLVFPVLVASLALSTTTGLAGFLGREPLVLGGKVSFALYLVHTVVFEIVDDLAHTLPQLAPGTPLWTFVQLPLVGVALGLSYLLWRYIEEPARLWMRKVGPSAAPRRRPAAERRSRAEVVSAALADRVGPSSPALRPELDAVHVVGSLQPAGQTAS